MRIHQYVRPELVILDLYSQDIADTIHALVDRIREHHVVGDPSALESTLLSRETVHTTAMGNGVAIPHATVPDLDHPAILVAIAPRGTPFGPVGLDPVRVFFLLLSPADQSGLHIKLLARIARLVRHPGFIARLRQAVTVEQLLQELERVDAEHV